MGFSQYKTKGGLALKEGKTTFLYSFPQPSAADLGENTRFLDLAIRCAHFPMSHCSAGKPQAGRKRVPGAPVTAAWRQPGSTGNGGV